MITFKQGDLFQSKCQTLVNTVNTVGVMGKGIALEFKKRYPDMFIEYKRLCTSKSFKMGTLWLWKRSDPWVLCFPTKIDWRDDSSTAYLYVGLSKFVDTYKDKGITSIAFPPLGCGNGNLDWAGNVKPLMIQYLSELPIEIEIYEPGEPYEL